MAKVNKEEQKLIQLLSAYIATFLYKEKAWLKSGQLKEPWSKEFREGFLFCIEGLMHDFAGFSYGAYELPTPETLLEYVNHYGKGDVVWCSNTICGSSDINLIGKPCNCEQIGGKPGVYVAHHCRLCDEEQKKTF